MCRDDGFWPEIFFAKEMLASVDALRPFQFASVMHFTVERMALVKMIQLLAGKASGRKRADTHLRLTAAGPRVFVEANQVTCGVEALVLREGTCRIKRGLLLRVLQTYHPRAHMTVDAEGAVLKFGTTTLPVEGYSPHAVAPGEFQKVSFSDAWLATKGPVVPPSASVPRVAFDDAQPGPWKVMCPSATRATCGWK